jgi:adenosine deaminase
MSQLDARTLRALTRAMPKAELHLHLDGSLRVDTALDIAHSRHIDAPPSFAAMRAALVAPEQLADQAALLRAFDLPIQLLQDAEAIERVAEDLVVDKAADNVRYLEIRWAPLLHTHRGLTGRQVVEAVWRGAHGAAKPRDVHVRLIATLMRSHRPEANLDFVLDLVQEGLPDGLVGVDLAGLEARFPDPEVHRGALDMARDLGLHVTVHAGEWGGAAQVRRALAVEPERIAHGPLAIDDPELVAELAARKVWLDLCPTSNVQANIVPTLAAHPFRRLMKAGVRVTLNTDDLTVADVTLSEEYARAVEHMGLTLPELWAVNTGAIEAAFCGEPTKEHLRTEFIAWGSEIPELLHR